MSRRIQSERVTIFEVAKAAGVSMATASKALNDTGRMTVETRERIRHRPDLGFRPNGLAQSLMRKRSFTVGLLTNDTYGRFSLPVMSGHLRSARRQRRLGVSVRRRGRPASGPAACRGDARQAGRRHHCHRQAHRPAAACRSLQSRHPRRSMPLPSRTRRAIAFVSDDAGRRAAVPSSICRRAGRRRIAHVSGPPSFAVVHARAEAYRAVLAEHGLPVEDAAARRLVGGMGARGRGATLRSRGTERPTPFLRQRSDRARRRRCAARARPRRPRRRCGHRLRQLGDRGGGRPARR